MRTGGRLDCGRRIMSVPTQRTGCNGEDHMLAAGGARVTEVGIVTHGVTPERRAALL